MALPKCSGRKIGLLALGAVNVNKEEEGQEFNNGSESQTCTTTSTRNYYYIKSFQNNVLPKSINLDRFFFFIQKLRNSVKKTKQFQSQGKERQRLPLIPKVKCKDKKYLNQFFLSRDEIYQAKIRLFRYCQERHFSLGLTKQ